MSPGPNSAAFILVDAPVLVGLMLGGSSPSARLPPAAIEEASPCVRAALQRLLDHSHRQALPRSDL